MKTAALGDVAEFINGAAFSERDWDEVGLPIIRIQNLTNPDKPFNRTQREVAASVRVEPGDLLVSWSATLGVFQWPDEAENAVLNQHIFRVLPRGGVVEKRYLFHLLTAALADMSRHLHGATMKHVNRGEFLGTRIPLPPIEEQRRIAAILDKADELRAKRRAALAHLDSLTQSIFLEMFGDPVTNTQRLPTARLDSICRLVRGSSPRPQGDSRYFGGPVLRLMVSDLTRDGLLVTPRIDSLTLEGAKRSRPVPASTIVMAVSGNVGVVSQLAVDACIHDGFVAFTLLDESRVRPLFLLYALHLSRSVHRKNTAGAIFQNLTTTDVNRLELVVPSIALQDTFIERLAAVRNMTEKLSMTISALDSLFASVQQRAFLGLL